MTMSLIFGGARRREGHGLSALWRGARVPGLTASGEPSPTEFPGGASEPVESVRSIRPNWQDRTAGPAVVETAVSLIVIVAMAVLGSLCVRDAINAFAATAERVALAPATGYMGCAEDRCTL